MLDLVSNRDARLSAEICLSEAFIRIAGFDVYQECWIECLTGMVVLEGCWMKCLTVMLGKLSVRNLGFNECQGCWIECLTWMLNWVVAVDAGLSV